MPSIIAFIFGVGFLTAIMLTLQHLERISRHLRIIRLQLEIQNPTFTSEELLDLDKNIKYWQDKMMKYRNSFDKKHADLQDLTFKIFLAYVERLNQYRVMVVEAKHSGDPTRIHDSYSSWLEMNHQRIAEMEDKAKTLDIGIRQDIDKKRLDLEFAGKWHQDER